MTKGQIVDLNGKVGAYQVPKKNSKFTIKDVQKIHVDVAKSLIEGQNAKEIKKTIIATEVIGKKTKQLKVDFDELFTKKWNEYCDLMEKSPKVHNMFCQQMKERDDLVEEQSKRFRKRFAKSQGLLSFLRKAEVEALRREEDAVGERIKELHRKVQEKLDAYYPSVLNKILNNEEVQFLLSQFPLEIELQLPKKQFEINPALNKWKEFFDNFRTARKPEINLKTGTSKWIVEFNDEVLSAMKAQIPLVKRKKANARLKAQASKNSESQRNLISSFLTQRKYLLQLERTPSCPYCERKFPSRKLNSNIHLDHIYPVSKGGQSVMENLVFICSDCNSKKSDNTLAIFCSQNGLDREAVTSQLLKLGKEV